MGFEVEFHNVHGQSASIGSAGPDTLVIDRPAEAGGRGLGFNGGQLLYLTIGGCISNDLFREAGARGIQLIRVRRRVIEPRGRLRADGLDPGPVTIGWHLQQESLCAPRRRSRRGRPTAPLFRQGASDQPERRERARPSRGVLPKRVVRNPNVGNRVRRLNDLDLSVAPDAPKHNLVLIAGAHPRPLAGPSNRGHMSRET